MTPEKKMQAIVETVGECWHEPVDPHSEDPKVRLCSCGMAYQTNHKGLNPSPSDLNALFELAEKLDLQIVTIQKKRKDLYLAYYCSEQKVCGNTAAEALLNMLCCVIGKSE